MILSRKLNDSRSIERLRQPREHREVSVKPDALQTTHTNGSQSELMLQSS